MMFHILSIVLFPVFPKLCLFRGVCLYIFNITWYQWLVNIAEQWWYQARFVGPHLKLLVFGCGTMTWDLSQQNTFATIQGLIPWFKRPWWRSKNMLSLDLFTWDKNTMLKFNLSTIVALTKPALCRLLWSWLPRYIATTSCRTFQAGKRPFRRPFRSVSFGLFLNSFLFMKHSLKRLQRTKIRQT